MNISRTVAALALSSGIAFAQSDYKIVAEATELLLEQTMEQEAKINANSEAIEKLAGKSTADKALEDGLRKNNARLGALDSSLNKKIDGISRNYSKKIGELEKAINELQGDSGSGNKVTTVNAVGPNSHSQDALPMMQDANTNGTAFNPVIEQSGDANKANSTITGSCSCDDMEKLKREIEKLKKKHDDEMTTALNKIMIIEQRMKLAHPKSEIVRPNGSPDNMRKLREQQERLKRLNDDVINNTSLAPSK